ncbi:NAD(P)-binding protein [Polychaeton citri CBS 116435]|uniref:NAD(P)-binding protein n=1 Tax=Polychaeton citri CBS 116435 TaxID=1314669 RepID=A0A9P4QJH1_9PEZI|nr:NAD(P)-binding protein [Polychaeton citri CBS 116435]
MPAPIYSIDFLALALTRSVFNPFIAWMIPICLRAVATPYHAPVFIYSVTYAGFLTLLFMLSVVSHRIAYGRPRDVNWEGEVVVVTGGGSGLGRVLVEAFRMRGVSVAILDVSVDGDEHNGRGLEGELAENVKWYQCDVSDAAEVEKVKGEVERDFGKCSILINNAGIVNARPLLELSSQEVQRNFNVNLISHFNTLRAFLPGMLTRDGDNEEASTDINKENENEEDLSHPLESPSSGGTIVTIASVLGRFPAANLSDYCAAKAGLIAMHTAFRAELAAAKQTDVIKTILVTPGQLSTPLFAGVETPSPFFGPVVEPVDLMREIMRLLERGEGGEISLPLYARWIQWVNILPVSIERVVRWVSGADRAMAKGASARRTTSMRKGQKKEE